MIGYVFNSRRFRAAIAAIASLVACSVQVEQSDETGSTAGSEETTSADPSVPPEASPADVTSPPRAAAATSDPNCQVASCCTLSSQIVGTSGADTLTGTSSAECLVGLGGNDSTNASGQNDEVFAGDGIDSVYGGSGNDLISGGVGADTLRGEAGNDTVYGGRDADYLYGGDNDDVLFPGMGADRVYGEAGNDSVRLRDVCEIASGEILDGGAGTDTLTTPVPVSELTQMGVTVTGFETVVVDPSRVCEAECRLPCSSIDPQYASWTDPTVWQVDAGSGKRFRRTTAAERAANHWLKGTYLVEDAAFVDGAALGTSPIFTYLPVSGTSLQAVSLTKSSSTSDTSKVLRRVTTATLDIAVTKPTVNTYLPTGFSTQSPHPVNGAWVGAITLSDGEILVYGAFNGQRVRVDGRNPGWTISSVPVPSGQPAIITSKVVAVNFLALGSYGVAAFNDCNTLQSSWSCGWLCDTTSVPCGDNGHGINLHECNDSLDNDGDGTIDSGDVECKHHSDYSCGVHTGHAHHYESGESFAIFADGRFCTARQANWFGELTRIGWESEALLAEATPGGTGGEPRYLAGGCWIFPSVSDAHACTMTGTCSSFASTYPYKNAGSSASGFYGAVWSDAGHGAEHGLDGALNQAVALYYGYDGTNQSSGDPNVVDIQCAGEDGSGCCGAMSWNTCSMVGGSAASYRSQGGDCNEDEGIHDTVAHEMGHNLGLDHEDGSHPYSFMHIGQHGQSDLSAANESSLVWGMENAECGRRPGFEWLALNPPPACGASCP
ncbi:MAG TPA: zinc-dependent metalloprotease family protein [Nannocystaceae bacterium]|nr:zinc-dependent metalloprotease family protein [Nannocystaceae bacterium]